jgi:PIN domain nuclease of toxin-antitoxin system
MFLWVCGDSRKLSRPVRDAIEDAATDIFVSAASAWEISIKAALGRLKFPLDQFRAMLIEKEFAELGITIEHALEAGNLPPHHADPFDRMLVAQARTEGLTLVSADDKLSAYDVALLRN